MTDVVLAQCDAATGCGTVVRVDLRGAADAERWRAMLDRGEAPCPRCGRKRLAPVATLQPQ